MARVGSAAGRAGRREARGAGMPLPAQWLAEALPLTHFIRLIRGIMLRDASLLELWPDAVALSVFTGVVMSIAVLRFRKRLD